MERTGAPLPTAGSGVPGAMALHTGKSPYQHRDSNMESQQLFWCQLFHHWCTEMEMSFWWNFHHWLHWKLSIWQLPVQPAMKISSKWQLPAMKISSKWYFHFSEAPEVVVMATSDATSNDKDGIMKTHGFQCKWVSVSIWRFGLSLGIQWQIESEDSV